MSTRWSNERILAEYKNIEANVMTIDESARYVALSDHRMICIIDIENPTTIAKKINRVSKWKVTASEWSKHQQNLLALSYNQTAAIYSFKGILSFNNGDNLCFDSESPNRIQEPIILLKGHRRNITDLNWAPFESNLIATSSIDTFVHIWDLRDYRRPSFSLSSIVGPNQVKWSKTDANVIATTFEGDIRLWDKRKPNTPIHFITAHEQKIHDFDWNPYHNGQFATCSQDRTVKFWDLSLSNKSASILSTKLPVWKAKYTPFHNGLITVVVPQLRRTGDINSLWLWNINNFDKPVHSFFGPTDVVIDFAWRWRPDFGIAELVTWSKDSTLRIWTVDQNILSLVNEKNEKPDLVVESDFKLDEEQDPRIIICNTINLESSNGDEEWKKLNSVIQSSQSLQKLKPLEQHVSKSNDYKEVFPNHKSLSFPTPLRSQENFKPSLETLSSLLTPFELQEEFALMSFNIGNLALEDLNPIKRYCIVSARSSISGIYIKLKINFPASYPNNVPPTFEILEEEKSERLRKASFYDLKDDLIRILSDTAQRQVKRNRPCLEPCLRDFVAFLDKGKKFLTSKPLPNASAIINYSTLYGSFHDAHVPFPKISGGRFCGTDFLVCYGKLPYLQQLNGSDEYTPRALSDFSAYLQTNYRPYPTRSEVVINELNIRKDNCEISSYPYYCSNNRKSRRLSMRSMTMYDQVSNKCGLIFIYRTSNLLPCSRTLAKNYTFDFQNKVKMCKENAAIALKENRKDLHQTWILALLSIDPELDSLQNDGMDVPWSVHPFGQKMIQSLIKFYLHSMGDIQTAAMLCCVFSSRCLICNRIACSKLNFCKNNTNLTLNEFSDDLQSQAGNDNSSLTASANLKPSSDWSFNKFSAFRNLRRNRSNSWSEYAENESNSNFGILSSYRMQNIESVFTQNKVSQLSDDNVKMLDSKINLNHECIKQLYADLLNRWGLVEKQAQVMKYVQSIYNFQNLDEKSKSINFVSFCQYCSKDCKESKCHACKKLSLKCSICQTSIRGSFNFCNFCGHAGHTWHMLEWFSSADYCPAGCGCNCVLI